MTTFESCIFKFQIPLMRSHCLLLQTWPHETFPPVASFTLLDLLNGCDNLYVIYLCEIIFVLLVQSLNLLTIINVRYFTDVALLVSKDYCLCALNSLSL